MHRDPVNRSHRAFRLAAPFALAVVCPSAASAGGMIADALSDDGIELAGALPDHELDDLRGGFAIGPYDIAFGIELRSTIDNMMQLVSRLNVSDRSGGQAYGTLTSWIETLTDAASGTTMPAVTVNTSPGAVTFAWGQSGAGSEVTHEFSNGLLSLFRNSNNNTALGQHVTVNVDMQNAARLMVGMRARAHALRTGSEIAGFRMSR